MGSLNVVAKTKNPPPVESAKKTGFIRMEETSIVRDWRDPYLEHQAPPGAMRNSDKTI